ncbi:MAG TPA: alpha/beta hydrolase [Steroidobacteraceae bacterium]|nr:alpha/beta hydrolase [Steroidobacteraceae bacterium]
MRTIDEGCRTDLPATSQSRYVSPAAIVPKTTAFRQTRRRTTAMKSALRCLSLTLALVLPATGAWTKDYEVVTRPNLEFAQHDGASLAGDLYLPKGLDKAPVMIAAHGGGWQVGSRTAYKYWGPFLARNGYALFSVDYRLGKAGTYPGSVYDVKAAIQFVRAKAADLGLDPERIGLMGDSAGGHLAALVGLAPDQFTAEYRGDPNYAVPANVKAVIGFYGAYDMLAQWHHDQIARPRDQIAEKYLGASPMQNRRVYFDSSPISYATIDRNRARFLLIHGTADDVVDPATQSQAFQNALNQAGIYVRRFVIPGAGHFWASDPFEGEVGGYGATAAPTILRFLEGAL